MGMWLCTVYIPRHGRCVSPADCRKSRRRGSSVSDHTAPVISFKTSGAALHRLGTYLDFLSCVQWVWAAAGLVIGNTYGSAGYLLLR